jgi:hypothetical protein
MASASRKLSDKLAVADWVAVTPVYLYGLTLDQIERMYVKEMKVRIGRTSLKQILNFYKVQYKCNMIQTTQMNRS